MPHSSEGALAAIEAALSAQNQQFAAFVEVFDALPLDTRFDVSPEVLRAIEATATETTPTLQTSRAVPCVIGALRA